MIIELPGILVLQPNYSKPQNRQYLWHREGDLSHTSSSVQVFSGNRHAYVAVYFQQQGQIAARARFSHGGMGNLNAMEPTHALVQTLSQNQDPKFQVSLHGNVSNVRGIFFRTNQEGQSD